MKDPNQMSIGEAIQAYLKERGISSDVAVQQVLDAWPRIMGNAIAENTEKAWFNSGIFYIKMRTPVWKNELSMARSKIKEILNREIGEDLIREVRVF